MDDPFEWSEMLHEARRAVAMPLESLTGGIDAGRIERIETMPDNIETHLLGPKMTVHPPFSQISDSSECC